MSIERSDQPAGDADVRTLLDRQAIAELEIRYAMAQDDDDWDAFASLIDDDVEAGMGGFGAPFGRAAFVDMARQAITSVPGGSSRHVVLNHLVELDGDVAVSTTYGLAALAGDVDGGRATGLAIGRYRKRLRRREGRWLVTHVEMIDTWPLDEASTRIIELMKGS